MNCRLPPATLPFASYHVLGRDHHFELVMDRIYHGCAYAKADGTRKVIGNGERCLVPTSRFVWKDPS